MASLRNLAITILRTAGVTCIAAALRYHARRPSRSLQTIMNPGPAVPGRGVCAAESAGCPVGSRRG
jgi:hypothetical protein